MGVLRETGDVRAELWYKVQRSWVSRLSWSGKENHFPFSAWGARVPVAIVSVNDSCVVTRVPLKGESSKSRSIKVSVERKYVVVASLLSRPIYGRKTDQIALRSLLGAGAGADSSELLAAGDPPTSIKSIESTLAFKYRPEESDRLVAWYVKIFRCFSGCE